MMVVEMVILQIHRGVVDPHLRCVVKINICHHDLPDVYLVKNELFRMIVILNVYVILMKNVVEYN
jgi:hypothetical protein